MFLLQTEARRPMSFIGTTTGALVEQWLRAAEARGPVTSTEVSGVTPSY